MATHGTYCTEMVFLPSDDPSSLPSAHDVAGVGCAAEQAKAARDSQQQQPLASFPPRSRPLTIDHPHHSPPRAPICQWPESWRGARSGDLQVTAACGRPLAWTPRPPYVAPGTGSTPPPWPAAYVRPLVSGDHSSAGFVNDRGPLSLRPSHRRPPSLLNLSAFQSGPRVPRANGYALACMLTQCLRTYANAGRVSVYR